MEYDIILECVVVWVWLHSAPWSVTLCIGSLEPGFLLEIHNTDTIRPHL